MSLQLARLEFYQVGNAISPTWFADCSMIVASARLNAFEGLETSKQGSELFLRQARVVDLYCYVLRAKCI